jgi:hypothetical protein
MIRETFRPTLDCTCDKCGYAWVVLGRTPPANCANKDCRSREWNGKKQRSHAKEIKLPAPRKGGRPRTITLFDYTEDL